MGIIKLQLGSNTPQSIQSTRSYSESNNIKTTFSTGFTHDEKPVTNCVIKPQIDDSIMDSVDTGFGSSNVIVKDCQKPNYKQSLYKENYLGEFKNETEKELARYNLGVYSKKEVNNLISHIIIGDISGNFITKDEVQTMLSNFVESTPQTYALYDIPNNLFQS